MSDLLTWQEYVTEALKTAPDQSDDRQLVQGALGLVSEAGEMRAAHGGDYREEAGDAYWYLAGVWDALDMPGEPTTEDDTRIGMELIDVAVDLTNAVEKRHYQLKNVSIREHARQCGATLAYHAGTRSIWTANIRKLRDRHGTSHEE